MKFTLGGGLFQILIDTRIETGQQCAGPGVFGKCRIRIKKQVAPLTDAENAILTDKELDSGARLACRCFPSRSEEVALIDDSVKPNTASKLAMKRFRFDVDRWPGVGSDEHAVAYETCFAIVKNKIFYHRATVLKYPDCARKVIHPPPARP